MKVGGGAGGALKVAAISVVVVALAAGAVVGMKMMNKKGGETTEASATPEPIELLATPVPEATPKKAPSSKTAAKSPAATPAPAPEPAPVPETAPAAPISTNEAVTDQVRQEVLTRIDKMPNLTPEKKDRLYNSVQRARDMRKLVEISFASGQSSMPASSGPQVKKLLEEPTVMRFRDDLTAVFVVLGFADSSGNEKANLEISERRASSVVDFMERQCGVKNVTHAVGMGGTNLVDKNNAAKNRIAEIWAVLP